jgi:hypothetical protein
LHSAHEVNGVWSLDALLFEPAKRLDQQPGPLAKESFEEIADMIEHHE